MRKIILASSSPRRVELLQKLAIPFEVIPSNFKEVVNSTLSPEEIVVALSKGKAETVASKNPDSIVIGADSLVFLDDKIFGKPADKKDAKYMLQTLSNKTHTVYTGITVILGKKILAETTATKVTLRKLSEKEIDDYIASGEPMDKAGAYALQEKGAVFIEKVEGDFYGAVGLSLFKLSSLLQKLNAME